MSDECHVWESRVAVGNASLYVRVCGRARSLIVLHGGPDFDHRYLLPDMDRLADSFRLVYYDQRGRGGSADGVRADDVMLESEVADLDAVREHIGLGSIALLGHSWGAVLALEYTLRHPDRVSHLILMNPAPASKDDFVLFKKERREKFAADSEQLQALAATDDYKNGDPDTVAAYYRIHFKRALKRAEDLDRIIASLRATFTREGILKARAVEDRLMDETWLASEYNLLPELERIDIPTLVIYGDRDFIPAACARHIADAIPAARLVTLPGCGHFPYLECPEAVREAMLDFLRESSAPAPPQ